MRALETLARAIDAINEQIGRLVSWLALLMVLVQFVVVGMRYVFGLSVLMMQESITYMHATIFLVAAGYTLLHNGHVRVDIIYGPASDKNKAIIDLIGVFFILLPMSGLIFWTAWPYVAAAWAVKEGSVEVSGIPGIYLLKTGILVFSSLLAIQGVSMVVKCLFTLMGVTPGYALDEEPKERGV